MLAELPLCSLGFESGRYSPGMGCTALRCQHVNGSDSSNSRPPSCCPTSASATCGTIFPPHVPLFSVAQTERHPPASMNTCLSRPSTNPQEQQLALMSVGSYMPDCQVSLLINFLRTHMSFSSPLCPHFPACFPSLQVLCPCDDGNPI